MSAAEEWAAQDAALAEVGMRRTLVGGGPMGTLLVVCERCGCAVILPAVHADACPAASPPT